MIFEPLKYGTRNVMLEAMASAKMKQENCILLAADKEVGSASKKFSYFPLDKPLDYFDRNRNLYEILPPHGEPLKLYFDLEMEELDFQPEKKELCLAKFLTFVRKEIDTVFAVKLAHADFCILDSCRENKLSYHVIVNAGMYFTSIYDMKTFALYIHRRIRNPQNDDEKALLELLTYKTLKKGEERIMMDPLPYTSYQNFRLLGQSKIGTPHVLKNLTAQWQGLETFVRLYNGAGDMKLVTEEMVSGLVEDKNNKKRKAPRSTDGGGKKVRSDQAASHSGLRTDGLTLMKKKNMTRQQLHLLPKWSRALHLIPNTYQDWEIYRNVAFAVRGAGGRKQDFVEWAKLSGKYEANDSVISGFDTYRVNGNGGNSFGATHLIEIANECGGGDHYGATKELVVMAKECDPDHYRGEEESLADYFDLNTEGIKIIQETSQFVSMEGTPDENNIFDEAKSLVIHAYLGRGKTTAIKRLLKSAGEGGRAATYLFLSSRQTFSQFIGGDFGCACYLNRDEEGDRVFSKTRLVVSVESLHRVTVNAYDVLVLDESESILKQLSSFTMDGLREKTWKKIEHYASKARKIIYADAFILNRTLDIARHLGGSDGITMIKNDTPPARRVAEELPAANFGAQLIQRVGEEKKVYACFSRLSKLQSAVDMMRGAGVENSRVKAALEGAQIYHSKVSDQVFETLRTINKTWREASMVITSPSNTIGCSYSPDAAPDFHEVWIEAFPTWCVRDIFQCQMRVRHTINDKMVYCIPTKSSMTFVKQRYEVQYKLFEAYESSSSTKESEIKKLVAELIGLREKEGGGSGRSTSLRSLYEKQSTTPEILRRLYFANLREETTSGMHFVAMFRTFLGKCGYTDEGPRILADDSIKDGEMASVSLESGKYVNIKSAKNVDEEESLEMAIKSKKATAAVKLRRLKWIFDKIVNWQLPEEVRAELFDEVYNKSWRGRVHMDNLGVFHGSQLEKTLCSSAPGAGAGSEDTPMQGLQLSVVRSFSKLLGIKNPEKGGVEITKKRLFSLVPYMKKYAGRIDAAFDFAPRAEGAPMNLRYIITTTRKIFSNFCGLNFKFEKEIDGFRSHQETVRSCEGGDHISMFAGEGDHDDLDAVEEIIVLPGGLRVVCDEEYF